MKKNIILTGDLAYDYIFDVKDPFSKYIQPDKIHQINISIVTESHKKSFGGTAGNQAFYLSRLGLKPFIYTTVGNDFNEYKIFLKKNKISISFIKIYKDLPTASGYVMTDIHDNQIWMFSAGAMKEAKRLALADIKSLDLEDSFVLISPTDLDAMVNFVNECCNLNIDFAFDPAFFIPNFPKNVLENGVKTAKIIFGNDYEISFIEKRIGKKLTQLINKNQILIKTLGNQGSEIFNKGKWTKIGIYKTKTVDPTGAGDAYRAAFLFGYLQNLPLKTCGWMGAVTASFAVEMKGTMNLKFTKKGFEKRLAKVI